MQKLTEKIRRQAVVLTMLVATVTAGLAQAATGPTEEANIKAYIQMLRKDLKRNKVAIITELMQLTPDEAAKFWPVYNEYDKALVALADERIALTRRYAENSKTIDDAGITSVANGLMDVESRRVQLKKQYFERMSKTVSVRQAARFLQIENQIEKLIDLQIMSMLPIVE
jgi:Spy/CpxP family protein refolding chaperone